MTENHSNTTSLLSLFEGSDVPVLPYADSDVCCMGSMWLTPSGEVKLTERFLAGYAEYTEKYSLMLRHSSITPSDYVEAEEKLKSAVASAVKKSKAEGDVSLSGIGNVTSAAKSDGKSVSIYKIDFDVKQIRQDTFDDEIVFYISYEGGGVGEIGHGVRRFDVITKHKSSQTRHINELLPTYSPLCEVTGFELEFLSADDKCYLSRLISGSSSLRVYCSLPNGEGWYTDCLLERLSVSSAVCCATLVASDVITRGYFDRKTRSFSKYNYSSTEVVKSTV